MIIWFYITDILWKSAITELKFNDEKVNLHLISESDRKRQFANMVDIWFTN